MSSKGFAIQCPNCGKWGVYNNTHPSEMAVDTLDEFDYIIEEFKKMRDREDSKNFCNPKLLRCTQPRWSCPSSFEAFIFKKEELALKALEKVSDAWAISRDFRLFKSDKMSRWDRDKHEHYYCIMFCTEEVPRQGTVEFEHLMDRKLLSRAILGISYEIQAPLTVYAANIFEPKNKPPEEYWMPIEGYLLGGEPLIPPTYNQFCSICRKIIIDQLVKEFDDKSPDNCPLEGFGDSSTQKCAGRNAACLAKDWNHCPAFIEQRKTRCPCYSSDFGVIQKLKRMWKQKELLLDGEVHLSGIEYNCHAAFGENAFPIIVHNHLVAVAMTGQVFFDKKQLIAIEKFIEDWFDLRGHEYELQSRQDVLLIGEEHKLTEYGKATFFISQEQFKERVKRLEPNIAKIDEMANTRYRDIRSRSENAFRQEILAYIRRFKKMPNFFKHPFLNILKRMQIFWAFKAVGFLRYSTQTRGVYVIDYRYKNGGIPDQDCFGFPGEKIGEVDSLYRQRHPLAWFYSHNTQETPRNPWIKKFLPLVDEVKLHLGLSLEEESSYFLVVIPYGDEVYVFAFLDRDVEKVSHIERREPNRVSDLCQEFMLRTCTEVIHELSDVSTFKESNIKETRGYGRSNPLYKKSEESNKGNHKI